MKIAIAGYGIEGESNYRYYKSDPDNVITIVDQKTPSNKIPDNIDVIIGDDAFEKLQDFDLVIRTASLSPSKIKTNGKIWSATNEFFSKCPAQIIGVTGTKGKGTTASLIASILEAAGKQVWLLGNIGKPALDYIDQIKKEDIVVYELSSFQLWDAVKSPHIAVVTLVEPEHLDIHKDFNDYLTSKTNIRKYQTRDDVCIYHPSNESSKKIAQSSALGKILRYGIKDDGGVFVEGQNFYQGEHKICSISELQLIGPHNLENACAAITVAKEYDVSDDDICHGLRLCKALPHRVEFVRKVDGVSYYDDSFSSSPAATVAVINSFSQPEVLIIGGIDRGGEFQEICSAINDKRNIRAIVLIGQIRHKLANMFAEFGLGNITSMCEANNMTEIVKVAQSKAYAGDVVILSPGCASFDMFENFYDRGDKFKKEVEAL